MLDLWCCGIFERFILFTIGCWSTWNCFHPHWRSVALRKSECFVFRQFHNWVSLSPVQYSNQGFGWIWRGLILSVRKSALWWGFWPSYQDVTDTAEISLSSGTRCSFHNCNIRPVASFPGNNMCCVRVGALAGGRDIIWMKSTSGDLRRLG